MPRSQKAQSVRTSAEFDMQHMLRAMVPPTSSPADYAWNAAAITDAKNMQAAGAFARPAMLAKKMQEDDAVYGAWQVRMSPEAAIEVDIIAAPGARGASIGAEGNALFGSRGVGLRPETRQDLLNDLVQNGVAIARNRLKPRPDGKRHDIEVAHWPIEHVHWDAHARTLITNVDASLSDGRSQVPITHGDGEWIVFAKTRNEPWVKHAAVLPAALVWSRHAFGVRDWQAASYSHANAKVTGELPPEFAFVDADGALTPQALAFLEILKAAAGFDSLAAILPPGAKLDMLSNPSTAHQIWQDIVNNAERAAHRIYNGTDASLGSPGGAPGVDILTLFGVSNTIGEGDLQALSRGFNEGAIAPWAALNFGDSSLAPRFAYLVPNADEQAAREAYAAREDAALTALERYRGLGIAITPEVVATVNERYDVSIPAPALQSAPAADPTEQTTD